MANYDLSDLGGTPTDNNDLSDLGGSVVNANAPMQQGLADKIAATPYGQAFLGAGHALGQLPTDVLNLMPGVKTTNPIPAQDNLPFNVGNIAGNIGGFIGGGELLDTARAASEGLPLIGKIAQGLGGAGLSGFARRALGSGAYGALTDQDNRLKGAGLTAGLSAIGDAGVPIVNYVRPQKYANSILDTISGGNSLENSAKSLAQDIKTAYQARIKEGQSLYDPVFSHSNNSVLGNNVLAQPGSQYSKLPPNLIKKFLPNTKELHQQFLENPTVQNAHVLQSQLGSDIRSLEPGKDVATKNTIQLYGKARDAIKSDIHGYLNKINPDLSDQYEKAGQNWLQNVVPYTEGRQLSKIASGENTNPTLGEIQSIFKNPEPETLKIASDLGPLAANKILYSQLGKTSATKSSDSLAKAISNLDQQGLGAYVSPGMRKGFNSLNNRISARNSLQNLSGALLGAHLTSSIPESVAGALIGGTATAPFMHIARSLIPDPIANAIGSAMQTAYPITRAGILSNLPGEQ
ncbi:MAG: hypothetical protein A3E87_01620 [Gammaproteobacteria bacterium RIFCSPHIGHO2_12_FULL_35_23]|nr:MAG: hypothetical protein A3E87_01620 [Gammaproteobacteria bacterium RIFCSPHIGHO2_12_FULL_35_23]